MSPRIQISGSQGPNLNYVAAVKAAGGLPLADYCPLPHPNCDGLVLCGGGDVDPALYGQEMDGSEEPDLARDRAELALVDHYWRAGKPILAICRGVQVLNVYLGGTLIQDLNDAIRPTHQWEGGDKVHPIRAEEDSLLARWYGKDFSVNSLHHQALDRLGDGLVVAARSLDGVIEGVEAPGHPVLGVQFHPERMTGAKVRPDTVDGGAVFRWLVDQCKR